MALKLPTAVLEHTTRDGVHYDWLLADPADADGLLWTARADLPPQLWVNAAAWSLTPIGAHRRAYLKYEGPVSGDRGVVRRIDQGTFVPELWTVSRIVIDIEMGLVRGRLELAKASDARWQARWH